MKDKYREAFEALIKDEMPSYNFSFRTYAKEHRKLDEMYMNPALHNLWLTWQAALEYARKEQQELLEKCKEALEVTVKEFSLTDKYANKVFDMCICNSAVSKAKQTLAALHAAGIGEKTCESGIPKTPKQSGLVDCKI